MASKRDLVEAQTYSRRRLLTAFVSGAPSGQELEPTKPMRGVVAGILLTVVLVLGSLAYGLLKPTLPAGWDDSSLVVVKDVGTRYVALKGTLYPVLNTTSARLVVPSSGFHVVQVSAKDIAGTPRGATIGIAGAPDSPPPADRLVGTGWLSCLVPDGARTTLGVDLPVDGATATSGVLVSVDDDLYVVAGGLRYLIPLEHQAAVLRALGLDTATPVPAPAGWLNLFPAGTDLAPVTLPDVGKQVPSVSGLPLDTVIGTVVEVSGVGTATKRYVVDQDGNLAPLGDLALPLYELGSGQDAAVVRTSAADVAGVRTATEPVAPADWPQAAPVAVPADRSACARLSTGDDGRVDLVTTLADPDAAPGVLVAPGGGALVRAADTDGGAGGVSLVDESGTAYPVPDASDEMLARLGYTPTHVTRVPPAWTALLPAGPALTQDAAAMQVGAAGA
ncbi:type VII secretion protein EccB [Cellulomonas sp. ICMP 17802]|uniref:type VII secretion protein EccB n=1 Tax=Cellulomonas sp. ICMP 17802 TaxID=3239199 RepID=UPI00351B3C49